MASPKATTETAIDTHGQYLVFTNRFCKVCSVQLNTRNRHDHQNFCKTHGLEHDRARMADKRGTPKTGATRVRETHHAANPEKQKAHSLLTKFLTDPRSKIAKDELLGCLVDYELINRFRDL